MRERSPDDLLSVNQLAAETSYSAWTIYRLVESRNLAAIRTGRTGRTIRIQRRDWEAFLTRQRVAALAESSPVKVHTRVSADSLPGSERYME